MASKITIKESKEGLGFVIALIQACANSMSDGRLGIGDLVHFFGAFQKAGPAFIGGHLVLKEMLDIDESEKKELIQYVKDNFDLPNDTIEMYVEKGLSVLIEMVALLSLLKKKK